jgi:hypothetical protein
MVDPTRHPGSREEDAWLSDEQLEQCSPAEAEPFQSPVPTRMISNGEYMPHPQTKQQQHVEYRIKELAETAAKKLGIKPPTVPRRDGRVSCVVHCHQRSVRLAVFQGQPGRDV